MQTEREAESECSFKARKAKKFCLRQALKLLSTERERLKASFKNQKGQKFCACGGHLYYYCELRERERLRLPVQSQKGQKSSVCGKHLYYCELREAEGTFSKPKRPKNFCLLQALLLL